MMNVESSSTAFGDMLRHWRTPDVVERSLNCPSTPDFRNGT